MAIGLRVSMSYFTVTWLLASGRSLLDDALLADLGVALDQAVREPGSAAASASVSRQAKPNIMPWSPASSPLSVLVDAHRDVGGLVLDGGHNAQDTWSKAIAPSV